MMGKINDKKKQILGNTIIIKGRLALGADAKMAKK